MSIKKKGTEKGLIPSEVSNITTKMKMKMKKLKTKRSYLSELADQD